MDEPDDWIDEAEEEALYDVRCTASTPDALYIEQEGAHPFWVPRSVVCEDSPVQEEGDQGDLILRTWWLSKGGPG